MSRRDQDLEALATELERTLESLRGEVRARRSPLRPPTPRELLRVTEEFTIPALVASLEATIRALELLQRLIRLTDPGRATRASDAGRRLDEASDAALAGVERTLADLRTALSAADLPEDPEARALVEDARELSAEIERRLAARGDRRPRETDDGASVVVPVEDENGADVDVEAELESIRRDLDES